VKVLLFVCVKVLERQQATGSLNVHQRPAFMPNFHQRKEIHGRPAGGRSGQGRSCDTDHAHAKRTGSASGKFDRVCRGSVAHQLQRAKSKGVLGVINHNRHPDRERGEADGRKVNFSDVHRDGEYDHATTAAALVRYRGRGGKDEGRELELMVVGDKFAPPASMSPLLRTQTQFSLSHQRLGMHSPDLYGGFERLPHLEQVRISMRHLDAHSDGSYGSRGQTPYSVHTNRMNTPYSTVTNRVNTPYSRGSNRVHTPFSTASGPTRPGMIEELKPFIKYSPDIKAQYNRQINLY
jgi:hypothetical protein